MLNYNYRLPWRMLTTVLREYYTKKVKVVIFQPRKVIFDEFQTNNNGWSVLSVVSKSGYKCQLSVKFLGICQLSVIFLAICQLSVNPIQTLLHVPCLESTVPRSSLFYNEFKVYTVRWLLFYCRLPWGPGATFVAERKRKNENPISTWYGWSQRSQ